MMIESILKSRTGHTAEKHHALDEDINYLNRQVVLCISFGALSDTTLHVQNG